MLRIRSPTGGGRFGRQFAQRAIAVAAWARGTMYSLCSDGRVRLDIEPEVRSVPTRAATPNGLIRCSASSVATSGVGGESGSETCAASAWSAVSSRVLIHTGHVGRTGR